MSRRLAPCAAVADRCFERAQICVFHKLAWFMSWYRHTHRCTSHSRLLPQAAAGQRRQPGGQRGGREPQHPLHQRRRQPHLLPLLAVSWRGAAGCSAPSPRLPLTLPGVRAAAGRLVTLRPRWLTSSSALPAARKVGGNRKCAWGAQGMPSASTHTQLRQGGWVQQLGVWRCKQAQLGMTGGLPACSPPAHMPSHMVTYTWNTNTWLTQPGAAAAGCSGTLQHSAAVRWAGSPPQPAAPRCGPAAEPLQCTARGKAQTKAIGHVEQGSCIALPLCSYRPSLVAAAAFTDAGGRAYTK